MSHRDRPSAWLAGLFLVLLLALVPAGRARADVTWLCHPSVQDDPCEIPLDTTLQDPAGDKVQTPERAPSAARPVDCFYVYPTVSNQLGLNATKARDPEIVSIAKYQAARFSSRCRMFAPIYRQFPLSGIGGLALGSGPGTPAAIAYGDVLEAWRTYLEKDNGGRGVVLLSHSQGTIMLRKLVREEIDRRPAERRRLVGAALLGGNVTVAAGKRTGGDFQEVPLCAQRDEAGCVVAYSTYSTDPGPASFFGNTRTDATTAVFDNPSGAGFAVACTDPGPLSGIGGPVRVTLPSEPFALGPINAGIVVTNGGPPPTASTSWVSPADRASGACRSISGAEVYRYDPVDGGRRPTEFPPAWGTHLLDMNLGVERLTAIAGRQADTWLARELTVARARRSRLPGTALVRISVPGPGVVELTAGRTARRATRRLAAPGVTTLRVTPSAATRRVLRRRGRARVRVFVRYRPAVGNVVTRRQTVTLFRRAA